MVAASGAAPAAAVTEAIPEQPFAIAPPNYCATSEGFWATEIAAPDTIAMWGSTKSYTAPGGTCGTPAPGYYNQFAATAVMKVLRSGIWESCGTSIHVVKSAGYYTALANNSVSDYCGAGLYRLQTQHRIIYYGVTYPSNPQLTRHSDSRLA